MDAIKENFDYSNSAYFELSQGVDLNNQSDSFSNRLTRLYVNAGFDLEKVSFSVQEFYFHQTSEHKLSSSMAYNFERSTLGTRFTYNSFNSSNTPVAKLAGYDFMIHLSDLFTFKNSIDYNILTKTINQNSYSMLYAPINNCWKIELNYARNLIEKKVGVLFYINYNENNFTSLNVR